jgi:hypothetical protein
MIKNPLVIGGNKYFTDRFPALLEYPLDNRFFAQLGKRFARKAYRVVPCWYNS